jgi:ATP-dependent 26S proteasome regulatory subunit
MEDFNNDKASILLLMGPPGTGKSTFIKHYIRKFGERAMLTHDEALLSSDGFLVRFLVNNDRNLLIVEDADLMLKSRNFAGNKIMSKLLNISDGVISLVKEKKIILTTNLSQLKDVDDAIVRPGRCFDIINFRKLDLKEAKEVCLTHGLHVPVGKEFTLAELFNQRKFTEAPDKIQMGLIAS